MTTKYDKEKDTTYYNFKCFSFEMADEAGSKPATTTPDEAVVDSGEVDDGRLPF